VADRRGVKQVDRNAEQVLQLGLKTAQIEQGRAGQRVDQNVEIAPLLVGPDQRRTEDARIA